MVIRHCLLNKVFRTHHIHLDHTGKNILHLKGIAWKKGFRPRIIYLLLRKLLFLHQGYGKDPGVRMVLLGSPYLHHQKPVTHPQNIEGGTDRCQGHPFDEGITREIIVTDLDQGPQFQELVIDPQGEFVSPFMLIFFWLPDSTVLFP